MIEAIVFFFLFTTIVHRAASGRWFWQPTWIIQAVPDYSTLGIQYQCIDRQAFGPLSHPLRARRFATREQAQRALDQYLNLDYRAERINKKQTSVKSWPREELEWWNN